MGGSVICHLNLNGPVFICFYLFRKTDKKQANKQNDKRHLLCTRWRRASMLTRTERNIDRLPLILYSVLSADYIVLCSHLVSEPPCILGPPHNSQTLSPAGNIYIPISFFFQASANISFPSKSHFGVTEWKHMALFSLSLAFLHASLYLASAFK